MGLFRKKPPKKEPELTFEQVERKVLGDPKAQPETREILGHEIPPRRLSQPEWEYKTVFETAWNYQTSSEDAILNSYGIEGWELVQIRDTNIDSQWFVAF